MNTPLTDSLEKLMITTTWIPPKYRHEARIELARVEAEVVRLREELSDALASRDRLAEINRGLVRDYNAMLLREVRLTEQVQALSLLPERETDPFAGSGIEPHHRKDFKPLPEREDA